MSFGDEYGMFWQDPPRVRKQGVAGPRVMPPLPETTWTLPEGAAAYPNLSGQGKIALDIETKDPELKTKGPGVRRDGKIVGVSIATEAGFAQYYPVDHEIGPNLPHNHVYGWLDEQLRRPGQPKVGAHILYDLDYLADADITVTGPFYDVQVAEPLLDENRLSYSLDSLSRHHLGEGKVETIMSKWLEEAFGPTNIKNNIWRAPAAVVGEYAEGDVTLPLRIFTRQEQALKEQEGLWELFLLESRLIPMLLAMRQRGVRINLSAAEEAYDRMGERCDSVAAEIKEATGIQPDVWAAANVAQIFDRVGVEYPLTAKTRQPSITKPWLERQVHPVAGLIKDIRRYDRFRNTFVKGYIINGHINGRIHTQFHQLRGDENGTVSGRFASSNPNLQNIPVRDPELGPLMRSMFLPEEGQLWWKYDWSQIEYRLIVHYAALLNLPGGCEASALYHADKNTDYHQMIADLAGLSRPDAKTLNFGLAYGEGLTLLCTQLGVDIVEGKRIIDTYHNRAPFIRRLARMATARAARTGEIRTLLDRRRHFALWEKKGVVSPERSPGARRAFTHKALNALIQGSAADVMKKAMVLTWEAGLYDVLGAPHLTVHDELDGSTDSSPASIEALAEVKHIMETCVDLKVPLLADGGIGNNWGSLAA